MSGDLDAIKEKLALAHHILTRAGSMGDITGHVMTRLPDGSGMMVRCRDMHDVGPGSVLATAFHACDFDGQALEELGKFKLPPERYIAAEIFKARPEVNSVVHAHPPAQIICGITGVDLRPILGCGNWGGMELALDGVPVFNRSILIASPSVGREMVDVLGRKSVVLLKGHGNVVVGGSIEEATIRAIQIENLAKVCWNVASAGLSAPDIAGEDIREFIAPTQVAAQANSSIFLTERMWIHYERVLKEDIPLYVEMGVAQ